MNVTVTRKEIARHAELLKMLEEWESLRGCCGDCNNGKIVISMRDSGPHASGNRSVTKTVDPYGYRHRPEIVEARVSAVCAKHVKAMVDEVQKLIKSELPLSE
ncbi:hypothetical protein [Rosistilla oblonga]|uniref:hypothetical protein n=1 Tax=Rosistilla oblonga TaxID=2527990 RepID=UPI003A969048